jgi:predicted outer membrane protein
VARRSWQTPALVVLGTLLAVSVLATAQPTTGVDERYLARAHRDHLAEIEAGRLAQERGSTATIREQGRRLATDHTALDRELQNVASLLDVSLPTEPTRLRRAQLRRAAERSGRDFDQTWTDQEIISHRRALQAAKDEAASGTSPYVQVLARETMPVLEAHLEMLSEVQAGAPGQPGSIPAGISGLAASRAPQDAGITAAAAPPVQSHLVTRPPVRLRLRPGAAGLDFPVRPVAIDRDGSLEIPEDPAVLGWWASGGSPGVGGTVVVVGHIDSPRSGAGPLAQLRTVRLSTRISVTTADGGQLGYRVVGRRTYRHDRLPAGLFARHGPARLALITCTGWYDRRRGHYLRTLVIYAVPARR